MHFIKATLLMSSCLHLLDLVQNAPYFGIDDDVDTHSESRRKHKIKKKRPCGRNDEGKSFFPFQVSYVNVNYNYNCGGGASGVPDVHDDDASDDNRPHKPHHHHQFINSKPLADPLSHDQTNAQQNKPINKPHRPLINFLQNSASGGFFGLFDGSLISSLFGNRPKPPVSTEEIPVHEDLDDVVQDVTEKLTPGQYVTAYNPINGQYLQEVSNFKPKRILKEISSIFDPIYDIF